MGVVGKAGREGRAGNRPATLENRLTSIDKAEGPDISADRAVVMPAKDASEINRVHSRFTSYGS